MFFANRLGSRGLLGGFMQASVFHELNIRSFGVTESLVDSPFLWIVLPDAYPDSFLPPLGIGWGTNKDFETMTDENRLASNLGGHINSFRAANNGMREFTNPLTRNLAQFPSY